MRPRPLPAQTTSFVGRTAELDLLRQSFAQGARLVTVLGPPGMGKSRLALRFAELCQAAGGLRCVALCELADASTAEDVCAALGRAIDAVVGEARGGDRVEELGGALARLGDALVILDNAERLVDIGPETIGRWLRLAPRARLLVTSRVRLRLAGEVVLELGPLPAAEGGQLFLGRARAARPSFAETPENARDIADLVQQLDGIPLALELGASRMGVLSPAQLLALLPRRLDVLAARVRDPAARQGTLREAIDASWGLLEPWEKAALAQLSVFRGGFSLAAAEAVVEPAGAGVRAPPMIDVLESLADNSLLFTRPARADEVRFGLYLSVRDHAAERLAAAGGARAAVARHAAFFLRVATEALEDEGAGAPAALERLALDRENLIAAHRALVASGGAGIDGALRIALALEGVLSRWGPVSLVISLLDEALGAGREAAAGLLLRAQIVRARACVRLGRLEEARAGFAQALARAQEEGDRRLEGVAAIGLGEVLRQQGHLVEAERRLLEGLTLLRSNPGPFTKLLARARNALGHAYMLTGRPAEARAQHEEALRLLQGDRDPDVETTTRVSLGLLALAERRFDEAAALLGAPSEPAGGALAEAAPLPPEPEPVRLGAVVYLLQEQGRLAEAVSAAEAAVSLARRSGNRRTEGFVLGQLGLIHLEAGDLAAAVAPLERGAALLVDAGDARASALHLASLAAARARLGQAHEAARLLARADEQLAPVGDPMLATVIDLYRAGVALAAAAPDAGAAAAQRIAEALGGGGTLDAPAPGSPAACSYHVRTAIRILRRGLAGPAAVAPPPQTSASRGGALIVAPDGRWCRLPDGRELTFQRARAQRLMLLRLLDERLRAPGRALTVEALFEGGWPGERAGAEAAHNRVYVAVSRLRKLGFQGLLLSRDDGFLLDPAVPTYRIERPL